MKTLNLVSGVAVALVALIASTSLRGTDLPSDLQPISSEAVPRSTCNFYSIANWPAWPPCPANVFSNSALYYSPSIGTWLIFADDREMQAARLLMSYDSGGDGGGYGLDGLDPVNDTTNLYISILSVTNQVVEGVTNLQAQLVVRNTTNAVPYEILSSLSITNAMSNWISEGVWIGLSSNTPANVLIGGRTNQNFFRAKVFNGFSNGVPTNGELFLLLSSNSPIQGIVNGTTNTLTNFYGSYAMARPPSTNGDILQTHSLNVGYDHSDGGDTNFLKDFPPQNVRALLGFSRTISNLCMASNLVATIDTHGWPNLQYLEMWHATNLIAANVTNCPKLYRVCFESIEDVGGTTNGIKDVLNFTGCTNLADLRAANNSITNIIFGPNGGSNVWHFCTRDARNKANPIIKGIPFASLPSLRQLWVWRDYSYVDNIFLTVTNCPKLESVQAFANYFQSAHFDGQTNLQDVLLSSMLSMTNLVITGCSNLLRLEADGDSLPRNVVDNVLTLLDQMGKIGGTVRLNGTGNAAPSYLGLTAMNSLLGKSWVVVTNPQNPVLSGLLVNASTNTATITWNTDVASDSVVYYGTTVSYGSSTNGNAGTTSHSVTITNLTPNTTYHFYVSSSAGANTGYSGNNQFLTGIPGTIRFVSTSTSVNMHVASTGGATVTFMWGDNTTNSSSLHTFGNSGPYTNYVTVVPTNALTEFGIVCGSSTTLSGVAGLTNYPGLKDLFFYQSGLSEISLAGGTNLVHIALAACNPSSSAEDQWFIDLAAAQSSLAFGTNAYCDGFQNYFFYPSSPGPTSASASARSYLSGLGWHLFPAP